VFRLIWSCLVRIRQCQHFPHRLWRCGAELCTCRIVQSARITEESRKFARDQTQRQHVSRFDDLRLIIYISLDLPTLYTLPAFAGTTGATGSRQSRRWVSPSSTATQRDRGGDCDRSGMRFAIDGELMQPFLVRDHLHVREIGLHSPDHLRLFEHLFRIWSGCGFLPSLHRCGLPACKPRHCSCTQPYLRNQTTKQQRKPGVRGLP